MKCASGSQEHTFGVSGSALSDQREREQREGATFDKRTNLMITTNLSIAEMFLRVLL